MASTAAVEGTALDDDVFGSLLLPAAGKPRSVDLWPAFFVGVPNVRPYQLATGKGGDPLAAGKPFVNNFLPTGGDMLRLNMAVPPTPRGDADFSTLGLVQAAVLGLTDARFNGSTDIEFIPNMDGFPNGRRLEDDVTTISLQAVSGVVLAAIGLWYDDYDPNTSASPVTDDLLGVLTYNAGPTQNDVPLLGSFPYQADPHDGYSYVKQLTAAAPGSATSTKIQSGFLNIGVPDSYELSQNYPNPFNPSTRIEYRATTAGPLAVRVYDVQGRLVQTLVDRNHSAGTHAIEWNAEGLPSGAYFYRIEAGGKTAAVRQALLVK